MENTTFAFSPTLLADVGLPMICISLPAMMLALLPVIAIEALIVRKRLSLTSSSAFSVSAKANVISTLVGIPLAWIAAFACQMLFGIAMLSALQLAPALGNIQSTNTTAETVFATLLSFAWIPEGQPWTVPLAEAVLLIPSFVASIWIERKVFRRCLVPERIDESHLNRAVRDANLLSYAGLLAFTIATMVWLVVAHRNDPGVFVKQLESRLSSEARTIDARELGTATWDGLFVFGSYFTEDGMCKAMRLSPAGCAASGLHKRVDENEFLIVFMKDGRVADKDRLPRTVANFDRSCIAREIPRTKALFTIDRARGNYLRREATLH